MPSFVKKFILSFLSFLILFFSVAPNFASAKAANTATWYNQDFPTWFGKVSDQTNPSEIFGERYTSAQVEWVIYGIFAFFINNVTPPGTASSCVSGDVDGCISSITSYFKLSQSQQKGPEQSLTSLVFADRPISGVSYLREKGQNFSLVPIAHAQTPGFGFSALDVVQDMWSKFRDIAFGLFVLIAIVFAFLIMFRVKLSPQTVISVQSALPKIIVSLVLVTFSYAIAGFLIDFMYIVIGLISVVMAPVIPTNFIQGTSYDAPKLFNLLTVGPTQSLYAGGIFGLLEIYLTPAIILFIALMFLSIGIGIASGGLGGIIVLISLAIAVVVLIIIIWMTLKTIWALFKAFANVLLLTIFAPLQLSLGTLIPNFGFGQWVKSYLSNLSVFVVTGVLWLMAWIFSIKAWDVVFSAGTNLTLKSAGTTTSPWPPLIGTGGAGWTGLLFLGVSFVLFTLIPKATEIVQGFISGKPFAYGSAIGEAFGPIRAGWGMTGAPIVGSFQKYSGEQMSLDIMRSLNNEMASGRLQWMPERVKNYVNRTAPRTTP